MLSVFSFASRPLSFALRSMSSSTSSTTAVLQVLSDNVPPPDKTAKRELMLKVKRLSDNATLPTRGSAQAAGYDLYRCAELLNPLAAEAAVRRFGRFSSGVSAWLDDLEIELNFLKRARSGGAGRGQGHCAHGHCHCCA